VSKIEIIDCDQGSPEWKKVRLGLVTASKMSVVMATGRGGGESKTRQDYLYDLAGEIITGEPTESYTNSFMDRGREQEDEARRLYAFEKDADLQRVGFIRNGTKGCSPDALQGDNGALEIKTTMARLLIKVMMRGEYPPEHKAQTQGTLWVTEREWIDIAIYCPKMPLFVERIHRDETYIKQIAGAVADFNIELRQMVEKIRSMS
jgi:YqaJ-like viral recombinase domain